MLSNQKRLMLQFLSIFGATHFSIDSRARGCVESLVLGGLVNYSGHEYRDGTYEIRLRITSAGRKAMRTEL